MPGFAQDFRGGGMILCKIFMNKSFHTETHFLPYGRKYMDILEQQARYVFFKCQLPSPVCMYTSNKYTEKYSLIYVRL